MSYTSIAVEYKENYAIVQLDGGKVNQINTAMLQDLKDVFLALDQDDSVQGVILSGRPHGYCKFILWWIRIRSSFLEMLSRDPSGDDPFFKTFCMCNYGLCPSRRNDSYPLCGLQNNGKRTKACYGDA